MRTTNRPRALFATLVAGLCLLAAPAHAQAVDDAIDVTVTVRDESGQPIPHVAVWSAIEYDRNRGKGGGKPGYLSVDDLWRVTQRYGALHDIISQFGDKPLESLRIPVMGDADGVFRETLDCEEATGKDNRCARPDPLTFGYTFMKRGYLPGRINFTAPKNRNRVEATVTLRRNPDEAPETQPYLQTFARLRHELSDTQRDLAMTEENRQRATALREAMAQAAQQALAAGDKSAAARIYSRMRFMPGLDIVDGRIVGWNHGDAGSPEARRALDKAYELDPDNLYVWMQTYPRRRALLPNPTTEERLAAALYEVEKLIAAKGDAVWPQYFVDQAAGHALLGRFEKAYRLYREAARREPKYMDWDIPIKPLREEMKRLGIAIPAD